MDIFDHTDYRQVLKDLYDARKKQDPRFSYRFIALKAGFKSAGFFTQILQGKTNISMSIALSLAAVFKLKTSEVEYFESLVQFNQAKTQSDKQHYFRKIISLKKGKLKTLDERQFELFTKWYYLAVREMIGIRKFKGDFKELADALVPCITPAEAREAVKVLEKLNLIQMRPSGIYEKLDAALTTGDYWKSVAITQFQIDTLELAKGSYDWVKPNLRNHSTLTLSISNGEYRWIKEELGNLRKRILEMAKSCPNPDRVYQINVNVFPLSQIHEE
ncbi:MAG: TIGR02147 family protein [Fibrobacterota bacterium]|nr:TIGR02147 family protein [Fibrobacterota bacterium]